MFRELYNGMQTEMNLAKSSLEKTQENFETQIKRAKVEFDAMSTKLDEIKVSQEHVGGKQEKIIEYLKEFDEKNRA